MSIEPRENGQKDFGTLHDCLVEGSAEQRARERRIRRRALIISIGAQTAIVSAIILVPLFGKPQRLAYAMIPIPPYYQSNAPEHPRTAPTPPQRRRNMNFCSTCNTPIAPNRPVPSDNTPPPEPTVGIGTPDGRNGPQPPWGIGINDGRRQPERPAEVRQTPRRLHLTNLEPAMLLQRVEPLYPPLARQIHREGQVELHALIATDGTIQSLQVVSGDPLFVQSALDAVRQWRYRPTFLNGQPVEIDTHITVIYTLQR